MKDASSDATADSTDSHHADRSSYSGSSVVARGVNWDKKALRALLGKWLQMDWMVTSERGGGGGSAEGAEKGCAVETCFCVRLRSACYIHSLAISSSL